MDNNGIEKAMITAQNRKNAVLSMCKAVLMLMAVTALSDFLMLSFTLLIERFAPQLIKLFMSIFMLFGAAKTDSYVVAQLVIGSEGFLKIVSMIRTLFSLVLPWTLFAKLEGIKLGECFRVNGKLVKPFFPLFCLCHLFTTVASVFSGAVNDFMLPDSSGVYEALTGVVSRQFNVCEFIISIFSIAVFTSIVEEYIFRGVLFSYLSRYGTHFGIVASAVIFGVAHSSPVQSVYAFVFGLVSATLVAVTGNIKTSILFHALNNFMTLSLGYVMASVSLEQFNLINCFYILILSAAGIYGIYVFCRKDGIMQMLSAVQEENDNPLAEKNGMKQIVVLPLVVYLVYYALSVFKTVM